VKPASNAITISCDSCDVDHVEEIIYPDVPAGAELRAYIPCPSVGRVFIPSERLLCWSVDHAALARWVAEHLEVAGDVQESVRERLWLLGKLTVAGQSRDIFLGRGVAWPDAATVLEAPRLQHAVLPIVFTLGRLPPVPEGGAPPRFV